MALRLVLSECKLTIKIVDISVIPIYFPLFPKQGAPMAKGDAKRHLRSVLESASRTILKDGCCPETRKGKLAIIYASTRSREELQKQKSISTITRFQLPMKASAGKFLQVQKDRLEHCENLTAFDIEGVAFVTTPTDVVTYQIIDTTIPSEEKPEESISVMQTLVRQNDNYVVGFRPTPEDPNDPDGFFLFKDKDIQVPPFLGKCYRLSCSSNYKWTEGIRVREGILETIVDCVRTIDKNTCRYVSVDKRKLIETKMVIIGETLRMQVPLEYFIDNYNSDSDIHLPDETLFYMRNWSYLSKAIFTFYLGLVELVLKVAGARESFIRGRRSLAAAVKKFKDKGYNLDLKGDNGFFSLRKLAGNCVRLLKYDEILVKKLIMRSELGYTASFKLVKKPPEELKKEDQELEVVKNKAEERSELEYCEGLLKASRLMEELLDLEDEDGPWKGVLP